MKVWVVEIYDNDYFDSRLIKYKIKTSLESATKYKEGYEKINNELDIYKDELDLARLSINALTFCNRPTKKEEYELECFSDVDYEKDEDMFRKRLFPHLYHLFGKFNLPVTIKEVEVED